MKQVLLSLTTILFCCVVITASSCVSKVPDSAMEEWDVVGFDEVTSGKDGELVTVTGTIDFKLLCPEQDSKRIGLCSTVLLREQALGLPINFSFCTAQRRNNCIIYNHIPAERSDPVLIDNEGKWIDFYGWYMMDPEKKAWTANPKSLKLTGRIKVINGKGRLEEPIEKVELE